MSTLDDPRVPRGTQTASRISPPTAAMTPDNSTPASPQQSHPSISPPTNLSTAATRARSRIRDVFFYDLQDSCALLGGLVLTRGITNVDFYTMVGIVIITSTTFFLQDDNGQTVPNDAQPLSIGNYFVVSDSPIYLNDEQIVMRTISLSTGTRQHEFREQVRQRDGRCVVSKVENVLAEVGVWTGFEAAHIFPLSHEHHWQEHNYGRWITLPPSAGGTINSVQNGLLLQSTLHQLFDNLFFSINPDVSFTFQYYCKPPTYIDIG